LYHPRKVKVQSITVARRSVMYYEIKAYEKIPVRKVSDVGQSKKPKRDDWKRERRQERKNKQARRIA
tara:strand:- start:193 stop:393 length:201 start_codon:yes stop_codon:yes gene_type:complete